MPTNTSGINRIQVAETDVTVGDVLEDFELSSSAHLQVTAVRKEKQGDTTMRYITLRNVETGDVVDWAWRFAIANQVVVGGSKLDDVRRNPSAYPKHNSLYIWKASVAKQFAVAS